MSILNELLEATGLERKGNESAQKFGVNLAITVNELPDEDWEKLSEGAQVWVNTVLKEVEKKGKGKAILPALPGLTDEDGAEAEAEEKPAKRTRAAKKGKEEKPDPKLAREGEMHTGSRVQRRSETGADKPKKAAKAKKEMAADGTVGARSKWGADQKIKLLVKDNPKRPSSSAHARFAAYESGMTVAEARAAGLTSGDLNYDTKHGYIEIK